MSPEDLPRKDNYPKHSDYERIEEITRIVLQVLEANKGITTQQDSRIARAWRWLSWDKVLFLISSSALLISWFVFGIAPWYEQAKLAQERDRLKQINSLAEEHVEVGNTFLEADEPKAAKEEFDKALQLDPDNVGAERGAFKVDVILDITEGVPATSTSISEPRFTQERLSLLLEEYPHDADLWAYWGLISPNIETALAGYQRALKIDPDHAFAHSGMALVYLEQGKLDQHLKMSKRAYELAPWRSIFENNYAFALDLKERYHDAIEVYEDLLYSDPQYLWAYIDVASLYRRTGDLQTAHSYGKQFIELSADEEILSLNRDEQALFYTGPNSDPVNISADPEKRYYGYYDIAVTSYLLGHTEEAESYVNKAKDIQIDPQAASEIKRVLNYDIGVLQGEQERFRAKADDFKTTFL